MKNLLLIFTFLVMSWASKAQSGTCGENLTWTITENVITGATLTVSGTGAMTNYTSESNVPWNYFRDRIFKVVVEEGVTSIGDYAFSGFRYTAAGVIIPGTLISIGNYAYSNFGGTFEYVVIPNSVTSIGDGAFNGCQIKSLTLSENLISIGKNAFAYCRGFLNVTISARVESIGDGAFNYCSGLTAINVAPSNLKYKSEDGVLFNKNQTLLLQYPRSKPGTPYLIYQELDISVYGYSYTIPNTVNTVGYEAFYGCGLTDIKIPNSVTTICDRAFSGCNFTTLAFPNSVKTIGNEACYSNHNLQSINFSNSLESIGYRAFSFCEKLMSVTIPESVTSIGVGAFEYCSSLNIVNYNAVNCTIQQGNTYYRNLFEYCGALSTLTIGSNVETIPDGIFSGCYSLTGTLTIPNSVRKIGDGAFESCSRFTGTLTIPNSVDSIGKQAFASCSGFTGTLTIPNAIDSIRDGAFAGCNGLTGLIISNSVKSIGDGAFSGCSNLTGELSIPESVVSIGNNAFSSCNKLTSLIISNSLNAIGGSAFYNCSGLTEIISEAIIPPALSYNVFYGVSNSIPVNIPCGAFNDYLNTGWSYFECLKDDIPQAICMVSVDANNHNRVVWQRNEEVEAYKIFREGNQTGKYDWVATVPYADGNSWTDDASNARVRSYRYKVSAVIDSCKETNLSPAHLTIHLTISTVMNNYWNLIWNAYEGANVQTCNIYRATSANGEMELVCSMPAGNTSFTDFDAPAGSVYYQVEIILDDACEVFAQNALVHTRSANANATSIRSNIATNTPSSTSINGVENKNLNIYPNPVKGELFIQSVQPVENVTIYDIAGKAMVNSKLSNGNSINVSYLQKGVYIVKAGSYIGKFLKE